MGNISITGEHFQLLLLYTVNLPSLVSNSTNGADKISLCQQSELPLKLLQLAFLIRH